MSKEQREKVPTTEAVSRPKCGIIMPIADMPGYPPGHWGDVRAILSEAIEDAGLHPSLVSNANEVTVIQKTIVQNLADNPIVVCDVSGRNPNVMFELGLRLAFDKPTVIVQDDRTKFSFDTAPIEHLLYAADLRFQTIVSFKETLATKLGDTLKAARDDPAYSPFIKHFGTYKVARLDEHDVTATQLISEEMRELKQLILALTPRPQQTAETFDAFPDGLIGDVEVLLEEYRKLPSFTTDEILAVISNRYPTASRAMLRQLIFRSLKRQKG